MSSLSTGNLIRYAAAAVFALAAASGCAGTSNTADPGLGVAPPAHTPTPTTEATPDPAPPPPPPPPKPASNGGSGSSSSWPTPEDCISYNPAALTMAYDAGYYTVKEGSKVVLRVPGQQGDTTGDKALALAKRYKKHCFLGRDNTREERNSYIFDYWRSASGATPTIPDQEEDCSEYDKTNLTVEDMGGGYGWRVKDHDHVLHLFDNESDARNGKLVLAKYRQICYIGSGGDDDNSGQDQVSYSL
jgi:hypothetical protein